VLDVRATPTMCDDGALVLQRQFVTPARRRRKGSGWDSTPRI